MNFGIVYGKAGVGKTTLMTKVAKRESKRGLQVMYLTQMREIELNEDAIIKEVENEEEVLREVLKGDSDLYVIDEIRLSKAVVINLKEFSKETGKSVLLSLQANRENGNITKLADFMLKPEKEELTIETTVTDFVR